MNNILNFNKKKLIYISMIIIAVGMFFFGRNNKTNNFEKEIKTEEKESTLEVAAAEEKNKEAVEKEDFLNELEAEEILVYELIYKDLSYENYDTAAVDIINSYEILDKILNKKQENKRYIYDGKTLKLLDENFEGRGLVFLGSSAAYFGDFKNGLPNGKIYGISAYEADAPRYDYIDAEFKDAKANGMGATGYVYLNNSGNTQVLSVNRAGEFNEDFLNGKISYELKDDKGSQDIWDIQADKGIIVLNESWRYDTEKNIYRIRSINDTGNELEIKAEDIDKDRFKNFIVWENK